MRKILIILAVCLAYALPASANQIVLEGSDATADHFDALYTSQLFTFMRGASPLPVLATPPPEVVLPAPPSPGK